ncbi:hypothetical protein TUBRATIS_24440 [Tubulinosema ratisbonensis]|uniref:Uncharacterized protein n=1 Tax=Tubulinosema ratisbonensis TaxID=291195 RepID=A0A437AJ76_9MICR|nr:hypothetical protein TUBRATIS_24440 [Tubulinosema ratisbonensis]
MLFYTNLFSIKALKNAFYYEFISRLTLTMAYFTLFLFIVGYYFYLRRNSTYHLVISSRLKWFIELSNSEKIIVILFFYFGIIFVVESCIRIFILKSTVYSLSISVILSIFTLAFNTWVFFDFLMIQNKKLFKKLFLFGIISFCLIVLIQNHLNNLIIYDKANYFLDDSLPLEAFLCYSKN